jgi:hypothetical protein
MTSAQRLPATESLINPAILKFVLNGKSIDENPI